MSRALRMLAAALVVPLLLAGGALHLCGCGLEAVAREATSPHACCQRAAATGEPGAPARTEAGLTAAACACPTLALERPHALDEAPPAAVATALASAPPAGALARAPLGRLAAPRGTWGRPPPGRLRPHVLFSVFRC